MVVVATVVVVVLLVVVVVVVGLVVVVLVVVVVGTEISNITIFDMSQRLEVLSSYQPTGFSSHSVKKRIGLIGKKTRISFSESTS